MKKISLIAIISLFSFSIFAQELTCLNKLLQYSRHSGLHQLSKEEWSDGKDYLDAEGARSAYVSLTGGKLMCKTGEIEIKIEPVCQQIIADLAASNVCYLFSTLGYFIISKDSKSNVNFIFSKDKRFTDQIRL
jgi:hypothetical protein